MKKVLKMIGILLVALPLFLTNDMTIKVEAAEESATVYLHKRIFRDLRWEKVQAETVAGWQYDNDGQLIEDDQKTIEDEVLTDNSVPLNGAIFKVYDFTAEYQKALSEGQSPTDFATAFMDRTYALEQIAATDKVAWTNSSNQGRLPEDPTAFVTERMTVPTNDGALQVQDGIVRLDFPKQQEGQDAAYLILETGLTDADELNVDLTQKSVPLMLTFPVADAAELDVIHLYPKNVGYVRDPYFYKLDATEKEPIAGVKFVLYREEEGKRLYLDQSATTDMRNKWVEAATADPLADERITVFVSDESGLVDTGERFLAAGTYYFEEVQAVEGYQITEDVKRIEVVVPPTWDTLVTVNGQSMAERGDGKVPQEAADAKQPRIYNTKISEEPVDPKNPVEPTPTRTNLPTTQGTATKSLPKTGEKRSFTLLWGILLIAAAAVLRQFRKIRVGRE